MIYCHSEILKVSDAIRPSRPSISSVHSSPVHSVPVLFHPTGEARASARAQGANHFRLTRRRRRRLSSQIAISEKIANFSSGGIQESSSGMARMISALCSQPHVRRGRASPMETSSSSRPLICSCRCGCGCWLRCGGGDGGMLNYVVLNEGQWRPTLDDAGVDSII